MSTTVANANVAALLATRAAGSPQAIALCETRAGRDRSLTFAELARQAAAGASLLARAGLRQGDGVLVFQPVSIDLYVALLALFRLGCMAVFADPGAGRAQLARACEIARPRAFFGPPRAHLLRWLSPALRRIEIAILTGPAPPWPGLVRWSALRSCPPPPDGIAAVAAETPALLTFTSGSTGLPKASVRTHGFLRAQRLALAENLRLLPGEKDLSTLPIFVLANLASGVTSVLPDADLRRPGQVDPHRLARQMARQQPTRLSASPALLERLLDAKVDLAGFRKIHTGGAPVFPHLLTRLRAAAGDAAEIVAVYGSTEAEPIALLSDRELTPDILQSIRQGQGLPAGCPVHAVRHRILADRWGEPLPEQTPEQFDRATRTAGLAGEIVVTGGHVLQGYLHGQGDADSKIRVGQDTWHRTGDAGLCDSEGRLWLLGRCAAKLSDAHGTLYPLQVEAAAHLAAPWIRRCALLGRGAERWLLVECSGPVSPCAPALLEQLSWAKLTGIQRVPRIPVDRRHHAKVDYPALRQQFGHRRKL